MKLKMEKNLAVLEGEQTNFLFFSEELRNQFRTYIEKIIKNPSVHTALLVHKNTQSPVDCFESAFIKETGKIHGREKWERLLDETHELLNLMETANVSWISVIHGACLGNHLELALACDYRVTNFNDNVVFGFPEVKFGLIPGFGGCIRLTRLIGVKKALEMILTSQNISSREAHRIRLVHEVVHPLDVEKHARALAEKIIKGHIPPKPSQKYKPLRFIDKCFEIPICQQILYHKTKKKIMANTKGFYPAPLKALEVIKKNHPVKFLKTALKEESNAFCDLTVSPVTKHLNYVYHTIFQKKESHRDFAHTPSAVNNVNLLNKGKTSSATEKTSLPANINKVAVMGAGVMGEGITHWLANHHVPVLLKDIHAPSLSSALKAIHFIWNRQTRTNGLSLLFKNIFGKKSTYKKNDFIMNNYTVNVGHNPTFKLNQLEANQTPLSFTKRQTNENHNALNNSGMGIKIQSHKIRPQMDYSGFQSVDLVIETVVENLDIKKKVIAETANKLSDKCLFATNTSSFSITELAKVHPDPKRFFGLHFFYPVYQTSLVEIVKGEKTNSATISTAVRWLAQNGKTPFIVKDKPGFLVHRLFLPLMSEALWLLYEGAGIQQIDQTYSDYGFSIGPFQLMDELGLDICLKLIKSFQARGRDLDFPKQISEIRPIFLGKKNRNGFYVYNNKSKVEAVNSLIYQDLKLKPSSRKIPETEYIERGLYRMINESALVLEDQVVNTPAELDLSLILGIGFPAFRGGLLRYADEISLKSVIAKLNNFSEKHGKRFRPSSALLKKAEKGFYKS